MGQYYNLACPETGTYLSASGMGSFVKAYEQVWSSSQPAMLALLLSAGRGDHPRDLPWAPEGLWAGRMPLMIGDYADENDLHGRDKLLGTTEEQIYDNCSDKPVRLDAKAARRKGLKDLSTALIPIYERSHGFRCSDINQDGTDGGQSRYGMRKFYPAMKTAQGWDLDLGDLEGKDRQDTLDYYERCGAMTDTTWKRAPIDISADLHFTPLCEVPDVIPDAEHGQGGAMIWVNLDRQEFVDPAAFGETPDLAGIMVGDSARCVLAMLVHHERRGGGDLGDLGPIQVAGRWRGDRIVLLGAKGFRPGKGARITPEEVTSTFTNVTDNAIGFIRCADYFGTENFDFQGECRSILSAVESKLIGIGMQVPGLSDNIKNISFEITPPTVITKALGGKVSLTEPLKLAGTFDIFIYGGKVFIPEDIRAQLRPVVASLPSQVLKLKMIKDGRRHTIQTDADAKAVKSFESNHEVIKACAMAA